MTTCTSTSVIPEEAGTRPSAEDNAAYVRRLLREKHPLTALWLEFRVLAEVKDAVPYWLRRP